MLLNYIFAVTLVLAETSGHEEASNRIVGGYFTNIKSFPFIVSIGYGRHFCGGVILSPRVIITAAHCINTAFGPIFVNAGTDDLKKTDEMLKVEQFTIHPKYNNWTLDFDFALLKLEKPLVYTDKIRNIKLPKYSATIDIERGSAAGWGNTQIFGDETNLLKAVDLEIYHKCRRVANHDVKNSMFCAGHHSGEKDTCAGDSGGPFVSDGTLYGIVSFGTGICAIGQPGVFGKVPYVVNWIQEYLERVETNY